MSATSPAPPVWKRALLGAVQGACLLAVVLAASNLLRGAAVLGPWPDGPALIVLGACVFAIGRAVAGSVPGACMGALGGLALGLAVATLFKVPAEPVVPSGERLSLAGPTLDGKTFDLEQYRGKVVLVDFWATWCPPCLKELPTIRALYDRHHEDGFEVVGVSLDHTRAALARFVQHEKLPWPQIYFDEAGKRGWDNPLARQYGVRSIPVLLLVSRDGVVVSGLRGEALTKAVDSLMSGGAAERPMHTNPRVLAGALVVGCLAGALAGSLLQRRLERRVPSAPQAG
jgi:thiol-disulfide isomerase/thioredoxin